MRRRWIACLFVFLPLTTGCTVIRQMDQNLAYEEKLFNSTRKHYKNIRNDANAVLKEISARHPHKEFTCDFIDGFHDGFRDYLEFGGPCRPPASPPPKYRIPKYLTPEGHCMVRDYFLGFQYGVDCAVATGMRQYYTLPILVTDQSPPPPLNIVVLPTPPDNLSTDKDKKETAPAPKAETPPVTPMPATPQPKAEPPKVEPKPDTPKVEPKPATPPTPMPKADPPKAETPKVDPPKVETPKVDPPKVETPKPIPPVEVPKVEPAPKPPTPTIPTSNPPAIPLVPTLPTVSLAPMAAPTPNVVPAHHTESNR